MSDPACLPSRCRPLVEAGARSALPLSLSLGLRLSLGLGLVLGPGIGLASGLRAQAPRPLPPAAEPAAAARHTRGAGIGAALQQWVADYESGRIRLHEVTNLVANSPVQYVRAALDAGAIELPAGQRGKRGNRGNRVSHFALLQRLVTAAEEHPSAATAGALLAVAATGFAHDMFDHKRLMIRDLGHFALLRMDAPVVWQHVYRVATTELAKKTGEGLEPLPAGLDAQSEFDLDARTMWRVAAIRLLGEKDKGVFRSPVEKCLASPDSRVRLAAAEAVGFLHKPQSLPEITAAVGSEEHPMVVVALVQSIQRILNEHALTAPEEQSAAALHAALGRLGKVDWRTDMAVIQLIHNHPLKAAVEPFIQVMRESRGEVDPILKIINHNASRFLGLEAHRACKRITGAIIPDDPDKWEEFWNEHKDEIVVRRAVPTDRSKTFAARGGGSFYGIPVLGSEVVFVLDTSGSMKTPVEAKVPSSYDRKKLVVMRGSRLEVARRQTLKAIQGMPKNSRFSIVTFNSTVHAWNRTPVGARAGARHTAASILGRLRPRGGTNVFDALVQVLEARDMGYGAKPTTGVDEIFVLSDGQPSGGVLTDPEAILKVVREINKLRKIRIHTVFAGSGGGSDFMRRLAEENGGKFVQQ